MTTSVPRLSALSRLRELPEVFTTKILAGSLGGNAAAASIYTQRWRKEGLISAAGKKAGVFYNLLVNPQGETECAIKALKILFPSAIIGGATALHDAGWTTQIPSAAEVLVIRRPTYPQLDAFSLYGRSQRWHQQLLQHLDGTDGWRLAPAAALADAWAHDGMWKPDPDDLEADDINWHAVAMTFNELGVPWPSEYGEFLCGDLLYARPRARP